MKNRLVLLIILCVFALLSAACAAQEATDVPGEVTQMPTTSVTEAVATGEADTTATGVVDNATPAEGTAETDMTATTSPDGSTSTQAAGGTAIVPETGGGDAGAPNDLDEVLRVLRAAGVTVQLGDTVQQELVTIPGQIIRINGEEVQIFTFDSLEELEVQASKLAGAGGPEAEPHFYKLGPMLVRYVGREPLVRDLLEDVLGAQAAGQ